MIFPATPVYLSMKSNETTHRPPPTVRAVTDLDTGKIVVTVEVNAPPARTFHALASPEIVEWWLRPGVFDTRTWTGDVRAGGRWHASGQGARGPYALDGEFLLVEAPRALIHTWSGAGIPGGTTTVSYLVESTASGARITLRHEGFTVPDVCAATSAGWETSLARLATYLDERP